MKITLEVNYDIEKITDFEKLTEVLSALQDAASEITTGDIKLKVTYIPPEMDFSS